MQEYPKALYLSGQQLVVEDHAQEATARADGYDDWHADHDRGNTTEEAGDEPAASRDELKARAKDLSIDHAPNITTDKLAALVAAAEAK